MRPVSTFTKRSESVSSISSLESAEHIDRTGGLFGTDKSFYFILFEFVSFSSQPFVLDFECCR